MANKKQLVISGVRVILTETNPRVKKNLLQVIIAMAYHGYLTLEGGNLMIEFVLRQCSLPDDNQNDVIIFKFLIDLWVHILDIWIDLKEKTTIRG